MSPELTDVLERRFRTEGPAVLRIENPAGETRVRAGAAGEVVVHARKRTYAGSADGGRRILENLEVEMQQEGNEIRVSQRAFMLERGWANVFRERRASVDYEVEVPKGSLVEIRTASGEIEVRGTEGAVELQSVSGDIQVADARGSTRLRTVSGDVIAESCAGMLDANSVSGDFIFRSSTWPAARLRTISGDVEAEVRLPGPGPIELNSISGDIQLATPSPFELHFDTTSGDLGGEGLKFEKVGRRSFTARSGEGGPDIHVRTVSGDATVRRADVVSPDAPVERVASAAGPAGVPGRDRKAEALDVLKALELGEIDADEAARRLDAVRK